jgi:exosortase/archaeosortase family protein
MRKKLPMIVALVLAVIALQWVWASARGTMVEKVVIDEVTVGAAVYVINALTPDAQARKNGSRISSPRGGINIMNGCEGTEALFILVGALYAYPLLWRSRVLGLVGGVIVIFVANQLRLLALFYSLRTDPIVFEQLHGFVAPLYMIVVALAYFLAILRLDERIQPPVGAHG